jgi:hypothetical protein
LQIGHIITGDKNQKLWFDRFAGMKASILTVLAAVFVIGCGHSDFIDRVVIKESANPYFFNGLHTIIDLPKTVPPEQLVKAVSKLELNKLGTVTNVAQTRQVQIHKEFFKDNNHPEFYTYLAVLVNSDKGQRVVLFNYSEFQLKGRKYGGWVYQVYEQ